MKLMGIGFTLFISAFFAVGLAMAGWGIYCALKSNNAAGWPSVRGTVNTCELKESSDSDGTTFRVHVEYSYEVSGRQYQGDRIAFGYSGSGGRAAHASLHEKLSRARTVTVRYNPSNPSEAVLTYGLNRSTIILLVFGLTWLLFTTGFAALWVLSGKTDKTMLNRIEVLEQRTANNPGEAVR